MKDHRQVVELDLDNILPNRFQPRIKFDEKAIVELSESIKEHGVIQPIIVRKIDDKFEIIAGERRYKASVMAGKTTIPAIVVDLNDKESSEIALIENVQRKDLTPIEEAISYRKIFDMGNITQEELATRLGVSQSTIANKMRLLNLDDEVQDALLDEKISERHARSLLKLSKMSEQKEMLKRIITERLTVRRTDEEIEKIIKGNSNMDIMDSFNTKVEEPIQNDNQNSNSNPFDLNSGVNNQVINNTKLVNNTNNENYSSNVNNIEVFDFADFGSINANIPNVPIIEDIPQNNEMPSSIPNFISNENNELINDNIIPQNPISDINMNIRQDKEETNIPNNTPFMENMNNNMNFNMPQTQIIEDEPSNIEVQQSNINMPSFDNNFVNNFIEQENIMPQNPIVEDYEFKTIVQDNSSGLTNEPVTDYTNTNLMNNITSFTNNEEENNDDTDGEFVEPKPGRFFNILSQDEEDDTEMSSTNEFNSLNNEESVSIDNPQSMNNSIFNSFTNFNTNIEQTNNQINEINNQENYNSSINNTFDYNTAPIIPSYDENDIMENNYNYSEPVKQQEPVAIEPTLKDIITMIRNCADDIEKQGFELDSEEFDFQDIYQVIFKIKKK